MSRTFDYIAHESTASVFRWAAWVGSPGKPDRYVSATEGPIGGLQGKVDRIRSVALRRCRKRRIEKLCDIWARRTNN